MIITITGKPCSGKSTIAKILESECNFKRISMGNMFKEEAKKRGMSIEEFSAYRVKDPTFDIEMDKKMPDFVRAQKSKNVVLESRVAFSLMPDAFSVFVDLDEETIAERLVNSDRTGKEKYTTLADAKRTTKNRWDNDVRLYKQIYGFDLSDLTQFDLVINSKGKTPEECARIVLEKAKKSRKNV